MVFGNVFRCFGCDFDGSKSILAVSSANLSVSTFFCYFLLTYMWLICKFVVLDMEIGEETLAPVSRKKKDFTEQELIDAMWTKGQYSFKVLKKYIFMTRL